VFQYGAIQAEHSAYDQRLDPYAAATRDRRGDSRPLIGVEVTRMIDVIASVAALIFLAPMFVVIALLIKLQDGGPVLFAHHRIGRGGQSFRCLKFRSMVVNAEERLREHLASNAEARKEWAENQKLRKDPRITPVGMFLRKSSIDELPQIINVLIGEMSLVGPRPIVASEIAHYGRSFRHYCCVRPGITGLWQVSGRNDVSYRRRVALDRAYVRGQGLGLYVLIMFKTVPAVLRSSGCY
jgi:lipopolysaccharide/colanic/teichoic acid biosynthesis glycosyltransferase